MKTEKIKGKMECNCFLTGVLKVLSFVRLHNV